MSNAQREVLFRYQFADIIFDEATFSLERDGQRIELEPKPLELLRLLLAHVDEVMTRDELLAKLWPERVTVENVLTNAVAKLRKALGAQAADHLETVPKIGYRIRGPIERHNVGQKFSSALQLQAKQSHPQRPHYILQEQLSGQPSREVWLAQHAKTGEKRVFKFASSAEGLSTLKREVTLYRLLQQSLSHSSGFVQIIDWNFEEMPFFVESEFCGSDLLHWKGLTEQNDKQRLNLALRIVETVAQAHSVGVLHKDIKPANILVDGPPDQPIVKLTDFGSGGILHSDLLEQAGVTRLGFTHDFQQESSAKTTLLYTSPEVLQGQIPDMRSDIYALGVLLFQLCVGNMQQPLTSDWQSYIEDELLAEDIAAATQSDPLKRPASAEQLAEKLRLLSARKQQRENEKQAALRLVETEEKLRSIQARRPWRIASALLLILGISATSWMALRADKAREEAEVKTVQADATAKFLNEVLLGADPQAPGAGADASVRKALSRATESIQSELANQPEIQAQLYETLGQVYVGLSDYKSALHARSQAVVIYSSYLLETHPTLIAAQLKLANSYTLAGDYANAEDLLSTLNALHPFEKLPRELKRVAWQTQGLIAIAQVKSEEALVWYEKALPLYNGKDGYPEKDELIKVHQIKSSMAQLYSRLDRKEEAAALLEELMNEPYTNPAIIPEWRQATTIAIYGSILLYNKQYAKAIDVFQTAIAKIRASYGPEHFRLGETQLMLAEALQFSHRLYESIVMLREAKKIVCKSENNPHCAWALGKLGEVQLLSLNTDEALPNLLVAYDKSIAIYGQAAPPVAILAYHLANAHLDKGNLTAARELIQTLDLSLLKQGDPVSPWEAMLQTIQARLNYQIQNDEAGKQQFVIAYDLLNSDQSGALHAYYYQRVLH